MKVNLRIEDQIRRLVAHFGAVIILIFTLFPIYWMILTAIKPKQETFTRIPVFWTWNPTLDSIKRLWVEPGIEFPTLLRNTLVVASGVTLLTIIISSLAAVSLTRLRYPGRRALGTAIFFSYLLPPSLLFIPLYFMMTRIHLRDTIPGLMLAHLTFTTPFAAWMLRGYFANIPKEIEDAAMVDGCSRLQALKHVVFPLAAPGIVASAIFSFSQSVNEFLYALVLTDRWSTQTMAVGLSNLMLGDTFIYDELMAGAVIMAIPSFLLYTFGQRYVVSGLTAGAIK